MIAPRYSNEDRRFELSTLNLLLFLQNIWKRWRKTDFRIIQGCNAMWCKPGAMSKAMSKAKSLNTTVQVGWGLITPPLLVLNILERHWKKSLNSLSKDDSITFFSRLLHKALNIHFHKLPRPFSLKYEKNSATCGAQIELFAMSVFGCSGLHQGYIHGVCSLNI